MNWHSLASRLSTHLERALATDAARSFGSVLIRPNPSWTALELLGSQEWEENASVGDATSFGFVLIGTASISEWLERVDGLAPATSARRFVGWEARLDTDERTEALAAALDALHSGLKEVALEIAKTLARLRAGPVAVLAGFKGEAGVMTISSATPSFVLPASNGWVGLVPQHGLELCTEKEGRRVLEPATALNVELLEVRVGDDTLTLTSRYARGEDQELWGWVEADDALELIRAHLEGRPGPAREERTLAAPRPAHAPSTSPEVAEWLTSWLEPQLAGPEADALLPSIGGIVVDVWDTGVRLFFSLPASLPTVINGHARARLENSLDGLSLRAPELTAQLVNGLVAVPAVARRAAGNLFIVTRSQERCDVWQHRFEGRAWQPERAADTFVFTSFEAAPTFER